MHSSSWSWIVWWSKWNIDAEKSYLRRWTLPLKQRLLFRLLAVGTSWSNHPPKRLNDQFGSQTVWSSIPVFFRSRKRKTHFVRSSRSTCPSLIEQRRRVQSVRPVCMHRCRVVSPMSAFWLSPWEETQILQHSNNVIFLNPGLLRHLKTVPMWQAEWCIHSVSFLKVSILEESIEVSFSCVSLQQFRIFGADTCGSSHCLHIKRARFLTNFFDVLKRFRLLLRSLHI